MAANDDEVANIFSKYKLSSPEKSTSEYERLGYGDAIPKPRPYFVVTEGVRKQATEVASRMHIGRRDNRDLQGYRVIGWYGPPGTGKNALAREIAAHLSLPFFEFDLGHGYDLLELIGGTGLRSTNGATVTAAVEGPLTAAARIGSIVTINEVVNLEGTQLSVLHAMIQDRKIVLPTAEAGDGTQQEAQSHRTLQVHPDTFFIFTWNPDLRNPDRQMPPPALLDRLRARHFGEDSEEDERRKLLSRLEFVLGKHISIEAIQNDVKLIRELRRVYDTGGLARRPYWRTLEDFAITRQQLGNKAAFDVLLNLCDQDPEEFQRQRDDTLRRHFHAYFGN